MNLTNTFAAVLLVLLAFHGAQAEVRIAVAAPLTGQNTFSGEQSLQGAEMAVADLNDEGGVLGEQVELLIGDDACDPEQAVAVAEKLAVEGVVFIAGHTCSHASIPASKVYEEAGILMISPASTNPKLTDEGGNNVFRVAGRDDRQGAIAADYLAETWNGRKIAILHDGTTYGKGLADETRKQLRDYGITEATYEAYSPGEPDYSELISRLQKVGIAVIYIGGYSTDAGLIVRQARDSGYDAQFVSGDSLTNDEFGLIAGAAANGTLVTFSPDARANPAAAPVVARFRARGFEPIGYTLHTYAAIQVWAQAAERAGSLSLDTLVTEMRDSEFDTVLGKISFDEKGDVTSAGFVWYVWRDGEYVALPQ